MRNSLLITAAAVAAFATFPALAQSVAPNVEVKPQVDVNAATVDTDAIVAAETAVAAALSPNASKSTATPVEVGLTAGMRVKGEENVLIGEVVDVYRVNGVVTRAIIKLPGDSLRALNGDQIAVHGEAAVTDLSLEEVAKLPTVQ